MSIVKFHCDNGANIHSRRTETIDTVRDLRLEEGEWEKMRDDDRYKMAEEWASNFIEIYYTED